MKANDALTQLDARGEYLEQLLSVSLASSPVPASLVRIGSMFWIAWYAETAPRTAEAIAEQTGPFYAHVFHGLLARGVALAPSAYEIGFVSLAHAQEDLEQLATTLTSVLADLEPPPASGVN